MPCALNGSTSIPWTLNYLFFVLNPLEKTNFVKGVIISIKLRTRWKEFAIAEWWFSVPILISSWLGTGTVIVEDWIFLCITMWLPLSLSSIRNSRLKIRDSKQTSWPERTRNLPNGYLKPCNKYFTVESFLYFLPEAVSKNNSNASIRFVRASSTEFPWLAYRVQDKGRRIAFPPVRWLRWIAGNPALKSPSIDKLLPIVY